MAARPSWGVSLSAFASSRENSLNLVKLLAALSVIYSHSYALCLGREAGSLLSVHTNGLTSPGGIAVGVFFLFGGFYIAKSCESHPGAADFFLIRCKRIFPQLAVLVFGCVLVLGPLATTLAPAEYFSSPETYRYLLNLALVPTHGLPGVFESTPYGSVINGALWTLPVEFACYVLCYLGYRLTRFDKRRVLALSAPCLLVTVAYFAFFDLAFWSVVRAVLLFYAGVLLWVYRDRVVLDERAGVLACLAFAALLLAKFDVVAMLLAFPYAILWLVYSPAVRRLGRAFDVFEPSYGVYLWGWPIQQVLVSLWPGAMAPAVNFALASVLALVAGTLSAGLVEGKWPAFLARAGGAELERVR